MGIHCISRQNHYKGQCKEPFAGSSVAHKELEQEEEQCYCKKIHILFIKIFKNLRLELLLLKFLQFVDNRIEAKFRIARLYICALTGHCNLLQHRLIQLGYYNIALLVLQQVSIHGNWFSFRRANSNTEDPYSLLGRCRCCSYRIILMVLSVCYKYYRLVALSHLAFTAETAHGCVDGISQSCSLNRHRLCTDTAEEYFGRDIIGCYGQLHKRLACKYNKANPVALQFVYKPRYCKFCPLKPVWRIIFCKH